MDHIEELENRIARLEMLLESQSANSFESTEQGTTLRGPVRIVDGQGNLTTKIESKNFNTAFMFYNKQKKLALSIGTD
jgi:hypothetical protein